tara:strand:+ start:1777 stop:2703 length:927 start_codon:yes stop_codon:yes gene_type:complete
MSFSGLMLAAGMAEAYNEDVARKKEQAAEILSAQTKYLMETGLLNIQNMRDKRKAAMGRIAEAKRFNFSDKSATALEMSGQLEFELEKIKKLISNDKLSETYIPTLVAHLEKQISDDEELAEAIARGLQGESFTTPEEMSLGLIASMGDLNELQEQFLKTTKGGKTAALPAFNYTQTKGARIELSDMKSIRAQLAGALNTIYDDSFTVTNTGDVILNQNADPDVQRLFNNLATKTQQLAESPLNSFSPTSALNTVIGSIENSRNVKPNTVLELMDEAITTPNFNWEPHRTINNNNDNNNNSNSSPVND